MSKWGLKQYLKKTKNKRRPIADRVGGGGEEIGRLEKGRRVELGRRRKGRGFKLGGYANKDNLVELDRPSLHGV